MRSRNTKTAKPKNETHAADMMIRDNRHGFLPPVRRLQDDMVDVTPLGKYKAITEKNMRVSPLLLLPRELRDYIWEYVLGSYLIFTTQPERPLAMSHDSDKYIKHPLAILCVCRTIYAEARFLPFAINNFWYRPTYPPMPSDVNDWWRKLMPAQFNAIHTVSMHLGRDITDTDILQVEALAPLVGLRTIVFNVYAGYTGSWRDVNDTNFEFMKKRLITRLEEVLEADEVTVIFK